MSENTTHVEGLEFRATDAGASTVAGKIDHAFGKVSQSAAMARERVGGLSRSFVVGAAGAIGFGFGLRSIYEQAKHANFEMDRVRKSVTGAQLAYQGWKKGVSVMDQVQHSTKQAGHVVHELEKMETDLRTPLQELAGTYTAAAAIGFGKVGMSQERVLNLTKQLTAAGEVYGTSGEGAAYKVTRALMRGKVSERDVSGFAIKMREWIGTLKKGEKLSPQVMMERLQKGMKDLIPAAKVMGNNLSGNLFVAKDAVEDMLRDLTRPLFLEQSKAVAEWASGLVKVSEHGKSAISIYGEKLRGAFSVLKDITVGIASHWKLIVGSMIAAKAAAMSSGFLGAVTGAGASAVGSSATVASVAAATAVAVRRDALGTPLVQMTPTVQSFGSRIGYASVGLREFTARMGQAIPALAGLYAASSALAEHLLKGKTESVAVGQKLTGFNFNLAGGASEESIAARKKYLKFVGLGEAGENTAAAIETFKAMSAEERGKWAASLHTKMVKSNMGGSGGGFGTAQAVYLVHDSSPKALAFAFAQANLDAMMRESPGLGVLTGNMLTWGGTPFDPNKKKAAGKGDINIGSLTITQEFKEADPDRVFHRVTNEIEGMRNTPGRGRLSEQTGGM